MLGLVHYRDVYDSNDSGKYMFVGGRDMPLGGCE